MEVHRDARTHTLTGGSRPDDGCACSVSELRRARDGEFATIAEVVTRG